MSNKKSSEPMSSSLPQIPQGSGAIEFDPAGDPIVHIDHDLVESLEDQIADKKNEIRNKVYAISCSKELFESYENFMQAKAEWVSTEALGIVEVNRQISKIKNDKIKDNTIYLGALPLEASHYFLSKTRGVGLSQAEDFLKLYKAFDQALADAKKDASDIKDLEKQLAAANQGLSLG
jgi:hypothetical protein